MIAKAFWEDRSGDRPVKYAPEDVIPDDHPKRAWLIRAGIAQDVATASEVGKRDGQDTAPAEPVDASASSAPAQSERPKPTDSVDVWRAFAKERGIDTKGLSKPQLIKATK